MNGDTLAKILLVLIILCFATFASAAEKVPLGSEPLAQEEAFVMDHTIVGPFETVIRWQFPKFYYLYKEKFIFTSKDFIIENVQFPTPEVIDDPFFGSSEIYHNVVEATLNLTPTIKGDSKGILDIGFQGCWEGGVCYPPVKTSLKLSGL